MTVLMIISIGVLTLALFLMFPIAKEYLYLISMFLLLSSLIYIFYLNRFELLVIGIDDDEVHLSFVNNSVFKRKDIKVRKEQVTLKQEGDKLFFLIDGEQQAIVRKEAVSISDWEKLSNNMRIKSN